MKLFADHIRYPVFMLLLMVGSALSAQSRVEGKVTNEEGEELVAVNIYLAKNNKIGAFSELDGSYSIDLPSGAETLVFSYIGYEEQRVEINGRTVINVTMKEEDAELDEVVVVAYGQAKKEDVIGATDAMSSRELENLQLPSFDQGLAGQVAGLQVRTGSGRPDAGAELLVRGIGTTGNNAPLIVVDGVPYGTYNNSEQDNFLALFNPNDIESISVVRDASGKALYGARAGNGLILITTKEGQEGKPKIQLNSYVGVSTIHNFEKPDNMNATELATFLRERIEDQAASRGEETVIPDNLMDPNQYGEGTDWFDLITQNGVQRNIDLSIRGGTAKTKYNISAGYYKNRGTLKTTGLERFSLRARVNSKVNDWLSFGVMLAPSMTISNTGNTDPTQGQFSAFHTVQVSRWADPTAPAYDENGNLTPTTRGELLPFFQANPLYKLENQKVENINRQIQSQITLEAELPLNLRAKQLLGANIIFNRGRTFSPGDVVGGGLTPFNTNPPGNSFVNARRREELRLISETTLHWDKKINDHNFEALVGYTAEYYQLDRLSVGNSFLINEDFDIFQTNNVYQFNPEDLTNPSLEEIPARFYINGGEEVRQRALIGMIGRLKYNYNQKYYVTASVRRDASSRFSADRRNAIFPALGLAWRASKEPWFPSGRILSNLRFELSVGETGSQQVDENFYQGTINRGDYVFGGVNAFGNTVGRLPNAQLQWETIKQIDVGIDLGFFRDRLNIEAIWYRARNTDLLFGNPLPSVTGFGVQISNLGELQNEGVEISLKAKPVVKDDFVWTIGGNISANRNEIVQIGTADVPIFNTPAGNGIRISRSFVGGPVGQYYGLELLGLYTPEMIEDPDVPKYPGATVGSPFYLDGDGDGQLELDQDYVFLGNPLPDFTYGINTFVTYKNFGLRVVASGEVGGLIFDLRREIELNTDGVFNVRRDEIQDRYRFGSTDYSLRAPTTTTVQSSQRYRTPTSAGVVSGTFLKIGNITLSYDFKDVLKDSKAISNLSVYFSAQNAFIFSEFDGNPEVRRNGTPFERNISYSSYPISRTFTAGFKMSL